MGWWNLPWPTEGCQNLSKIKKMSTQEYGSLGSPAQGARVQMEWGKQLSAQYQSLKWERCSNRELETAAWYGILEPDKVRMAFTWWVSVIAATEEIGHIEGRLRKYAEDNESQLTIRKGNYNYRKEIIEWILLC